MVFFLPVLSLSNHKKTISNLSKNYKYYKKIGSKFWAMPKSLCKMIKIKIYSFFSKKKSNRFSN